MATKAAAASSINLNDVFVPPVHTGGARRLSLGEGESLPSLGGTMASAGPGPGSLQGTAKLSGQVLALSNAKERAVSTGATRRSAGPPGIGSPDAFPAPPPHYSDGPTGGQQNPRLPPLMYGIGPPGRSPPVPSLGLSGTPAGVPSQQLGGPQQPLEPITQHPATLPSGPAPASYPYAPKRKPPSAFMRNNPLKQQLEYQQVLVGATRGAASARGPSPALQAGASADQLLLHVDAAQHTQLANDVLAEAAAALAQGGAAGAAAGGGYGGSYTAAASPATAPWGVSSVSDLEALDSILDQLVVVDARMRKALLKGPLISFETVVPDPAGGHGGRAASARGRQAAEDERDRTFLTAVKGITEDAGQEEEAPAPAPVEPPPLVLPPPDAAGAPGPGTGRAITWGQAEEAEEPPPPQGASDSAMFPASIPNTGMHPSFTRAYLASKAAPKAVLTPPPPPATAEHLLRSRPPPFIAAPSYEELCGQIRDVQRQYTCGSNKPPAGTPAAAAAAAAAVATATTNQYIAGLDGPALEDVVAQQDLPISLERVRPTFVALKHKARAPSPKRRAGSPGRGDAGGGAGANGGEALAGRGL